VERSETPGPVNQKKLAARGAGDGGCDNQIAWMPLSAASRTLIHFVDHSWGSASLHPRLYAYAGFAG